MKKVWLITGARIRLDVTDPESIRDAVAQSRDTFFRESAGEHAVAAQMAVVEEKLLAVRDLCEQIH